MLTVDDVFAQYRRLVTDVSPVAATQHGDHSRDADLDDWPPGTADDRVRAIRRLRRALDQAEDPHGDRELLADRLDAWAFGIEGLRSYERDPSFWLGLATGGVYELLRRDDLDPAPLRAAAQARAAQVPRLLEQAKATLGEISGPHREVALHRVPGAVGLFTDLLPDAGARDACAAFGAWLESAGGPAPEWRLGEDLWGQALRLSLGVTMPPDEVQARAWAEAEQAQAEAEEAAAEVLAGRTDGLAGADLVRAALDVVAEDRAGRATLVPEARAVLGEIVEYLRADDTFPLPEPDTLRVEELPRFMQGAFAACLVSAPPLEPSAAHTYYLSPVPGEWDDARATSFLREYNRSALRSVGIHEAYPGHYVQLAHAQAHPRLLRRMLANGAFVEGWAVYVERVVVGSGFGDAALRLTGAKLALRVTANALLDQGLHVNRWTDDEAMELMTARAYQEQAEATGKLLRGKVTAGQLSTYFVGGQEMADLRHDAEAVPGFTPARFHRDVLAQGSPPFPVLRDDLGVPRG